MKKLSKRKIKWIERTAKNNRSYKLYLYNRFFSYLLLILLQIVGYVFAAYLIVYGSSMAVVLQIVIAALELVVVLYLLNKTERVASKINWILLILLAPVIGVPGYLMYGEGQPTRKMKNKIDDAKANVFQEERRVYANAENCSTGLSRYLAKCGYAPAFDGDVIYYESGEKAFPDMLVALNAAKKYILLDYFIIAHGRMWEEILQILLKKAEEGVKIRIIYDDFGCMMTLPPKYDRYLETLHKNIRCMTFNNVVPIFAVRMNNRDHRKIMVVDGTVAFTGGINIADEYINEKKRFGYWKDTAVKITGSGVRSFIKMFFYTWNAFHKDKEDVTWYTSDFPALDPLQTGEYLIQPYDDSPLDNTSVSEFVYADMIQRAKRYIYVFTPYLVLDDYLRAELLMAAARGVDVRIILPGIPDKKTIYRVTRANAYPLMKAGVKIYEYTSGFVHAKGMVCDDEYATVGTVNFDYRSLFFHFENAVYFTKKDAVAQVKKDAEETFATSKLWTVENTKRTAFGRLVDSILRIFETLF